MKQHSSHEAWGSRIGLILAMAGNAVGLGNFLRFPTEATNNGGGSFMIAYFVALFLLGIPLMWIEWGIGRHAGRYRKGHVPGMFAALWKHPAAKYLGVLGLIIPLVVLIFYTYIESWTLAFTFFSLTKDYWGITTQAGMSDYVQAYQGIADPTLANLGLPFLFFLITLALNIWVISRGISGGIERLAKIGMPILFLFAAILAIVVFFLPAQPGIGTTAADGFEFIYRPDLSGLGSAGVWLAAAGQIFFTLSVGLGALQSYASYLSKKDDILLSGIATAATNETAEVILGGSIAIPAAVVFFGVTGATQIAASGSFNLGFAAMPVVFQQLPLGNLLGFMWFGLLFVAGITSSVAMSMPIVAFFREEFNIKRETVALALGVVVLIFGCFHIRFLGQGFLDEWNYWGGTFGLAFLAMVEVVIFMWIFSPDRAWNSIHEGADIQLPKFVKFVMTFITPAYLIVLFLWWGYSEAWPILTMEQDPNGAAYTPESLPIVMLSRAIMFGMAVVFSYFVWLAWKRNGYDDRAGFKEVSNH